MKEFRFQRAIYIGLLFTATFTTLIVSLVWILSEISGFKHERSKLREQSILHQKEKLMREVNSVIDYITYQDKTNTDLSIDELQNNILDYLACIRFGFGGYIFVNKVDGQALVFDGQKLTEYRNNIDLKDSRGNSILEPQIEAFHNKEIGGFMHYFFKRLDGDKEEPKLSYMKGYHKWNWIIGAGDYLVDIENEIAILEAQLNRNLKTKIIFISLVFLVLIIIIILISIYLNRYINKEFNVFEKYYKHSKSHDLIDLSALTISELKNIASMSNTMIKEIDDKTKKLKESEGKFRAIIENSADAIFITDDQGNYLYVNKEASKLLGYSNKELIKMNIKDLSTKDQVDEPFQRFKKLYKEGSMFIEMELLHKNKSVVPVDLNAVVLPDGRVFGSCRNISRRKNTENELHKHQTQLETLVKKRTSELEEKNEELERFNKLFIGREFRIKELKDKLKELEEGKNQSL